MWLLQLQHKQHHLIWTKIKIIKLLELLQLPFKLNLSSKYSKLIKLLELLQLQKTELLILEYTEFIAKLMNTLKVTRIHEITTITK